LKSLKQITPYEELAIEKTKNDNLKQLACSIMLSAIEDGDIEFLTDDYNEWKYYRDKRKKKSEVLNELDYRLEFQSKQDLKDAVFELCKIHVKPSDIPKKILDEKRMYETNTISKLVELTSYKKETLMNVAKLHGWKIGIDYVEPTMFDDDF